MQVHSSSESWIWWGKVTIHPWCLTPSTSTTVLVEATWDLTLVFMMRSCQWSADFDLFISFLNCDSILLDQTDAADDTFSSQMLNQPLPRGYVTPHILHLWNQEIVCDWNTFICLKNQYQYILIVIKGMCIVFESKHTFNTLLRQLLWNSIHCKFSTIINL